MRPILLALLVIFIGLSTTHARANEPPRTTGEMYNACKPIAGTQSFSLQGVELFNAGYCLGMIVSVANELGMNCLLKKDHTSFRADIYSVSRSALTQAFVNYARDNPQDWQNPPFSGLVAAFRHYFPCTK